MWLYSSVIKLSKMSFRQLEQTLGSIQAYTAGNPKIPAHVKYGTSYKVKYDFKSMGIAKGKRENAYFSNCASVLGVLTAKLVPDVSVFDGYNTEMISVDGQPAVELVAKHINSMFDIDKRSMAHRVRALTMNNRDNVISVIYNMLRLYYIKGLQETNPQLTLRKEGIYYDDGHISIKNKTIYPDMRELQISSFDVVSNVHEEHQEFDAAFDYVAVRDIDSQNSQVLTVSKTLLNSKTVSVIRLACSEFDSQGIPIKIMHSSPRLIAAIDVFGDSATYTQGDDARLSQLTITDIKSAITQYVETHRYHAQFDVAYMMLTQVLYSHKPRSAEAMIWNTKDDIMLMPEVCSLRGCQSTTMAGVPFVVNSAAWDTYYNWRSTPNRIILHSLALSEAVQCSTFDYATRRKINNSGVFEDEYDDPFFKYAGSYPIKECGIIKELTLLAMRFDRTFKAPWQTSVGLLRYNWLEPVTQTDKTEIDITLLDPNAVRVYNVRTHNQQGQPQVKHKLILDTLPPCCYPLFSMEINKSDFYMNDMTLTTELEYDPGYDAYVTTNTAQAHRFMNITRLAGWDVTCKRQSDQKTFNNWAANSNGHYLPTFAKNYKKHELYIFDHNNFKKRKYNWCPLPNFGSTITLEAKLEYRSFLMYYDNKENTTPLVRYVIKADVVKARNMNATTDAAIAYSSFIIEKPQRIMEYEDFRMAHQGHNLVPIAQLAPIQQEVNPLVIEQQEQDEVAD
uniref:Capsid protein n=1 Tax=Uromyces fabae virus TaxID=3069272 RepID=A0AA51UCH5_9VIRU|nr:capsid protein [Uromyces fabae virus]